MSGSLKYLAIAAMIATAFVLLRGLVHMMRGGDGITSNKLMQARVFLQFVAVVLLVLAMYFGRPA
ncbi:MAG: twin transmembrane helix small protein [Rhizobiaceae bacterium]